jgi:chromate transporter
MDSRVDEAGEPAGTASSSGAAWPVVLVAFARIGATSFGGGSATVAAMRRLCLERGWLEEREFVDDLVLSRLTPGISILAQTLLIGRRVAGWRGMSAALAGMVVPSIAITLALAWTYRTVSGHPWAQAPLQAVAGVAAGYAVALAVQLLRDILRQGLPLRGFLIFLGFTLVGWAIGDPLIVMGVAILAALVVPTVFDVAAGKTVDTPSGPVRKP